MLSVFIANNDYVHRDTSLNICSSNIILYVFPDNIQISVVYDKILSVIPAKAGIHVIATLLDPCFRRDDNVNRSV